jgi:hypothetical protein
MSDTTTLRSILLQLQSSKIGESPLRSSLPVPCPAGVSAGSVHGASMLTPIKSPMGVPPRTCATVGRRFSAGFAGSDEYRFVFLAEQLAKTRAEAEALKSENEALKAQLVAAANGAGGAEAAELTEHEPEVEADDVNAYLRMQLAMLEAENEELRDAQCAAEVGSRRPQMMEAATWVTPVAAPVARKDIGVSPLFPSIAARPHCDCMAEEFYSPHQYFTFAPWLQPDVGVTEAATGEEDGVVAEGADACSPPFHTPQEFDLPQCVVGSWQEQARALDAWSTPVSPVRFVLREVGRALPQLCLSLSV